MTASVCIVSAFESSFNKCAFERSSSELIGHCVAIAT